MTSTGALVSRPVAFPMLVAAPILLAIGWFTRARIGRLLRLRPGDRVRPQTSPRRGNADLAQEEVVRALLGSDRERFDELGRPVYLPVGGSSRREQGAAPIDLRNVDE